jgi:hypothetical protein
MTDYRAYTVGTDGHFIGFEPLVCRDDSEAVVKATRLVDGHDVELWSAERFVIRLAAHQNNNAAPMSYFDQNGIQASE